MDDAVEVSRRVAEFSRTGNPEALWTGLTEAARVRAAREIERVTRDVLAGGRPAFSTDSTPHALGVAGHTTGMGPVVGRWIEDGRVEASPELAAIFARHLDHGRRRVARIAHEAAPALDALVSAGIPLVALKGAHTGRVYFDEPGMRRLSDVDILIPDRCVMDAERALTAAGFSPSGAPHRPYKRDWIGNHVDRRFFSVELADARTTWAVEVHASLDRVYHVGAVAHLDSLRDLTKPLSIDGRMLQVLAPPLLVVYLACHCSQELDSIRLLRVYEIARVIRQEQEKGRLDWSEVLALLDRAAARSFVYPALSLIEDLAPGTVDGRVLERARAASTWSARHTVPRLAPAGGSLDERGILRQLMWTRSPTAVGLRVLRNVWPASISRPADVLPAWRARLRRIRAGSMSIRAPDERADRH